MQTDMPKSHRNVRYSGERTHLRRNLRSTQTLRRHSDHVMASHLSGGNMTNRFLFALIVLSSFVEATFPAGAIPVPFAILGIQSTDASGAFILVRKGKGHGDREERFE